MKHDKFIDLLAILGEADDDILFALTGSEWGQDTLLLWQDVDGRYRLPPQQQQDRLTQLEMADPHKFRLLHETALAHLTDRLHAGDDHIESIWDAVFERLASRLYANDRAAFLILLDDVADTPLQTPSARQRRRFYQGGVHLVRDDYDLALAVFKELLAQSNLVPTIRGRALNAQALIYRLTGQLEEAQRGYKESLALWRQLGNKYYEGMALMNMGVAAYELRDYAEAETALRQAETIFEEIRALHWLAVVHNELGLVRRDLGQWEEALAYFQQFIAQRRRDKAAHHIGLGLLNTGEVLLFQGRLDEAIATLTEALQFIDAKLYSVDVYLHLALAYQATGDLTAADGWLQQALAAAEAIRRREILPHVYYHLGDLRQHQGDMAAAEKAWVRAVAIIEETRQPLRDEALKISLLGRWQQVYEALILHCLAQGRPAEAFGWGERARARAFADALISEVERPSLPSIASLSDIQTNLPPDTAMFCYFTTGVLEQDIPLLRAIPADNPLREHLLLPPHTLLFVIMREEIAVHDCGIDPNRFATHSPRGYDATRFLKTTVLRRLRQSLLEPARSALTHDHLLIIPHGPLHRIPFTALLHGERPSTESNPVISYAPSGTLFWQSCLRPMPVSAGKGLAVGVNGRRHGRLLEYTEAEVRLAADLLAGEAWTGDQPKKEQLRETAVACRWLHIASHGWFDDADPLASYLETGAGERLTAREVLASWQLQAELVTLSACETGVNQILRGDEPMGLIRAFLYVGAKAVLVSQWPVDDLATCLLMYRFYTILEQGTADLDRALHEAQQWLRQLTVSRAQTLMGDLAIQPLPDTWLVLERGAMPFAPPQYWAGFILVGRTRRSFELNVKPEGV